jgi:hypothetical protein
LVLQRAAVHFSLASRDAKWRLYREAFPPTVGERVLDVGVSRFVDIPGVNYFLKRYPFPWQITGVGISDLTSARFAYREVCFIQADGRDLPFDDKSFDVVHSNAVLEHVGPRPEQRRFVAELVRVGKAGFVTTPNRWFPFDMHSRLPVLHWFPEPMAREMRRITRTRSHDTWLLARRGFISLFDPGGADLRLVKLSIGHWPASLIVLFRDEERADHQEA